MVESNITKSTLTAIVLLAGISISEASFQEQMDERVATAYSTTAEDRSHRAIQCLKVLRDNTKDNDYAIARGLDSAALYIREQDAEIAGLQETLTERDETIVTLQVDLGQREVEMLAMNAMFMEQREALEAALAAQQEENDILRVYIQERAQADAGPQTGVGYLASFVLGDKVVKKIGRAAGRTYDDGANAALEAARSASTSPATSSEDGAESGDAR